MPKILKGEGEWKAKQIKDGEWVKHGKYLLVGCCDCGLVHFVELRIGENGAIEYRATRDKKLTNLSRKKKRLIKIK